MKISQDSWCQIRGLNLGSPKYEAEVYQPD